jgi:hypothetical protein
VAGCPDVVTDMAKALGAAAGDTFAAEQAVIELLYKILPGWTLLFPVRRSWLWTPKAAIDVWNVTSAHAAVRALHQAGFVEGVTLHQHRAERYLSCECKRHMPSDPR